MFVEHKELVEFFKLRVCGVCLSLNQISAARVWYLKYKVPLLPSNESQSCKNCTSFFRNFFRPQEDLKQGYSRNLGLALNSCLRHGALIPRTALILILALLFFCV